MNNQSRGIISKSLGVQPIEINSQLVSAQYRRRLYWTNIPNITQPEDKNINFNKTIWRRPHGYFTEYTRFHKKSPCITTRIANDYKIIEENGDKRKISVGECEELQTLTMEYTSIVSDAQRYKCIGNCWTVDVIAHILKNIKTDEQST